MKKIRRRKPKTAFLAPHGSRFRPSEVAPRFLLFAVLSPIGFLYFLEKLLVGFRGNSVPNKL